MNDRIKELLHEAMSQSFNSIDRDGDMNKMYIPDVFTEKFAELIVKECIETLRLVPYNSDREFGDEVIYQDAVKKHFGVEE